MTRTRRASPNRSRHGCSPPRSTCSVSKTRAANRIASVAYTRFASTTPKYSDGATGPRSISRMSSARFTTGAKAVVASSSTVGTSDTIAGKESASSTGER